MKPNPVQRVENAPSPLNPTLTHATMKFQSLSPRSLASFAVKRASLSATSVHLRALCVILLAPLAVNTPAAVPLKNPSVVAYSDFGAKGDGQTDDSAAIAKAHAYANKNKLPVRADNGAVYYIGGASKTIYIKTDTDFGSAKFIIDDTNVKKTNAWIFNIATDLREFSPGIRTLRQNQKNIGSTLPSDCLVVVKNDHVYHYIRYGSNRNDGSPQRDVFVVDKDGNVDKNTPIVWTFDDITNITAYPIDKTTLTVTGGVFITIANSEDKKQNYYARGISVTRSNVVIENIRHEVTGEGDIGAPYSGFISVSQCANVTVKNCVLTGHKTFRQIGSAGRPVSKGSYDLNANTAANISFVKCTQTNDINDKTYWGIMGSNFCKNLLYDGCVLSRFDAHQGVTNATIRNCTLGHQGINAIGFGTLTVENTTVRAANFINLRADYGSTWLGYFVIRDCVLAPPDGTPRNIINGSYTGMHNFGYVCNMPVKIVIDGLRIHDNPPSPRKPAPALFADFNKLRTSDAYVEKFPYVLTKEVILKDVTATSGKKLRLSDNPHMFNAVKITRLGSTL
jgi:hypothetical protein